MVALVLEGLSATDFMVNEHLFPHLKRHFENRVEILAPSHYGSGVPQELASVPLSINQKHKILESKFEEVELNIKLYLQVHLIIYVF